MVQEIDSEDYTAQAMLKMLTGLEQWALSRGWRPFGGGPGGGGILVGHTEGAVILDCA